MFIYLSFLTYKKIKDFFGNFFCFNRVASELHDLLRMIWQVDFAFSGDCEGEVGRHCPVDFL